jgi:ABC-2 type transport system ATP-binding protein
VTAAVEVTDLSKRYGDVAAVDSATFSIEADTITGLLGRNGAGKTTVMQLLTGQEFATSGRIEVFGQDPVENSDLLARTCFVKESQKYPDDFSPKHVFASAPWFFENWDAAYAERLIADFRLPLGRRIKKLSRGQLSSIGVIVGLASRAPLTFFDEPYLGLDAVARQIFYDRLLEDFAEHLIDEVSDLLEQVIVIDDGRNIVDSSADELRGSAVTVVGPRAAVDAFVATRDVLHRETFGGLASVTIGGVEHADLAAATAAGLETAPVSLQQLIVRTTAGAASEPAFTRPAAKPAAATPGRTAP